MVGPRLLYLFEAIKCRFSVLLSCFIFLVFGRLAFVGSFTGELVALFLSCLVFSWFSGLLLVENVFPAPS